jgi:hypothetical protein
MAPDQAEEALACESHVAHHDVTERISRTLAHELDVEVSSVVYLSPCTL